ncbi:uncharacterized protein A1O9_09709 [Exophiala aquamarina CBS 119918]|uniref:Alcohol dehydrogenase n=1 Tax=Exophiala aquamarina CBS 119918 TaxID=1182545 RepID=A0A072P1B8_9EURO|nr:uncharacterized protein A1O9_09709 [Exophiala aquamarina CBS 119918]KEF53914.1 hypothetical protein A1O9_09709 [Exophiala aquamarina CBS 119918]
MASSPVPSPKTQLGVNRVLGPNCSLKVSPLCLGAMNFGRNMNGALCLSLGFLCSLIPRSAVSGTFDKETTYKILDEFRASGGNFVDTANM